MCTMTVQITTETDASPIIRVLANRLRHAFRDNDARPGFDAVVELISAADARRISVQVAKDAIHLKSGASSNRHLAITVDFNTMNVSNIEGHWRYPLIAMKVNKLLNQPDPHWADSAKHFWSLVSDEPGVPGSLVITCRDEDRSVTFGEGPGIELVGTAKHLNEALTGSSLIAMMVITGQLRFRGSMQDLADISQAGQKIMLGELHG